MTTMAAERRIMPHVDLKERFKKARYRSRTGIHGQEQAVQEVERCLNCDIQTVFTANLCIECDACVDICPTNCLTITENGDEEPILRTRLVRARRKSGAGPLYVSEELPQTSAGHGQRRGSLRALQPVCRTLSDRRVGYAEIEFPGAVRRDELDEVRVQSSAASGISVRTAQRGTASMTLSSRSLRSTAPARPVPTAASQGDISAWAFLSSARTTFRRISRDCRRGTRSG